MNYKNLDIKVFDNYSVTIMHQEFIFAYNEPNHFCKSDYKDKYSNFGGLQCNFKPESKEYEDLYDYLLKVSQNVLKTVYGL